MQITSVNTHKIEKEKSNKKGIAPFLLLIAVAIMLLPNICNADNGTAEKMVNSSVSLSHGENITYYADINDAIKNIQAGDTIELINNGSQLNDVTIDKNMTLNLGTYQMGIINLKITNGADVKIIGQKQDKNRGIIYNAQANKSVIIIEEGTVTIDGAAIQNTGASIQGTQTQMIKVGQNNSSKQAKLIIKNKARLLADGNAIQTNGNNSTVDIESAELIEGHDYGIALNGNGNILNIKGGDMINGHHAAISAHNGSKNAKINISGGKIINSVWVYGENPHLTMTGGNIDCGSGYAMEVGGKDAIVDIKKGEIAGRRGSIAGYSGAVNSTINIEGGIIKTYIDKVNFGDGKKSAAIYLQNVGNLNIKGGTIEGEMGIVALNGKVNISGGTVTATGTGTGEPFWDNESTAYNLGVPVIVNNTKGGSAKVTITGGKLNSTYEKSLLSYGNKATDYSVSGGIYNHPFNSQFVVPNELEITITNQDETLWYVGQSALAALNNAKNDINNIIDVLQGNLTIEGAIEGLIVKNTGEGNVKVNDIVVETGKTVVAPKPKDPINSEPNSNETEGNSTIESTSAKNPKTSDSLISYLVTLLLSTICLVFTLKKKFN